jgi:hypothetical protein
MIAQEAVLEMVTVSIGVSIKHALKRLFKRVEKPVATFWGRRYCLDQFNITDE